MAIKFEKIQAGQTLYDRHRYSMGNTTIKALGEWKVEILEVSPMSRTARVRWNGNPEQWWHERRLAKLFSWSMNDPDVEVTKNSFGATLRIKRKKKVKVASEP